MKKKVIKVEYRKDSERFPEYLKYEITLLNENGTMTKIPAYGKDLQDALSRVVHDERVDRISSKASRIPTLAWVLIWTGYVLGVTYLFTATEKPAVMYAGIPAAIGVIMLIQYWGKRRNKNLMQR